jgi:hypothetical protein
MRRSVVPALTLAAVAAAAVGSYSVKAEPLSLTSSQMEAVSAAGPAINVSPRTNVNAGNVTFTQNLNLTNQTAAALAVALATCGICSGNVPGAEAVAAAANANRTGQGVLE